MEAVNTVRIRKSTWDTSHQKFPEGIGGILNNKKA